MKKLAAKNEELEEEKKDAEKKAAEKKAVNKKKELEKKPKVEEQLRPSRKILNEKDYADRPEITLTLLDQYRMSKES